MIPRQKSFETGPHVRDPRALWPILHVMSPLLVSKSLRSKRDKPSSVYVLSCNQILWLHFYDPFRFQYLEQERNIAPTRPHTPGGGGALGYFLGGYVPPGTPNWHPVLKKISAKIDTPF